MTDAQGRVSVRYHVIDGDDTRVMMIETFDTSHPGCPFYIMESVSVVLRKRGRGRPSSGKPKPWETAGLPKSTYFKKLAREKV